jgi:hypothetical protein
LTGFNAAYKAVFDSVKAALVHVPAVPAHDDVPAVPESGVASIKTVVLGEEFSLGDLPKAVINALPSPIAPEALDGVLKVTVRFSVVVVIREYEPKDWFVDIIPVMGDVVDAVLADATLSGLNCFPTVFSPGEIKFGDKTWYGGLVGFELMMLYQGGGGA